MMGPKRDWRDARAKVEDEGRCRICHIERGLQAAHVTRREFDRPKPGQKTRWVNPDSIIALCPVCHAAYDRHELSILAHLTHAEQVKALEDMNTRLRLFVGVLTRWITRERWKRPVGILYWRIHP